MAKLIALESVAPNIELRHGRRAGGKIATFWFENGKWLAVHYKKKRRKDE